MNNNDARAALEGHVASLWAASVHSGVKLYFSNPPVSDPSPPYVLMNIPWQKARPKSLGSFLEPTWYEIEGVLYFRVFTDLDSGTALSCSIIDTLFEFFNRKTASLGESGTIKFREVADRALGALEGKWVETLSVSFVRNVLK